MYKDGRVRLAANNRDFWGRQKHYSFPADIETKLCKKDASC
jgi:hypothetical protein